MRILALEPYYGGSHKAFLDGWSSRSAHEWTRLTLPAYKWKWRMRHSAITFAEQVTELCNDARNETAHWDAIFCSDMLPLAEFRGLAPESVRKLPAVLYFHENQLTYPNQLAYQHGERDHHFAFTNFVSAMAADAIWFNSEFHRSEFFTAFESFLARMPDYPLTSELDKIRERSSVHPPGIVAGPERPAREPGPLRILWNARWEHDKNPDQFFEAIRELRKTTKFRLSVVGESFDHQPGVFRLAEEEFASVTDQWGFVPDRAAYNQILDSADVVVSTAIHEFFGIAIAEAAAAGAIPVVPRRLAYPELFEGSDPKSDFFFYDGSVSQLVQKLRSLAEIVSPSKGTTAPESMAELAELRRRSTTLARRFSWSGLVAAMDDSLRKLSAR